MPEVYSIVRSLAQRMGMPVPKIYFVESPEPNAFATGRNPRHAALAVTRGMMSYSEFEAILAHELSHVKNRDILIGSIAATIGAAMSFFARMAFWGSMGRRNNNGAIGAIAGLAAIIIAPLVALIIRMAISRAREFEADRSGAITTGSPLVLAGALRKLDQGRPGSRWMWGPRHRPCSSPIPTGLCRRSSVNNCGSVECSQLTADPRAYRASQRDGDGNPLITARREDP